MSKHEQKYDSINELAVVGDFGFQRIEGPFSAEKTGTVWSVLIPMNTHPTVSTLPDQEGEAAAIVADAEIVGGGIITDVIASEDDETLTVLIDQYARGGDSA